VMIDPIVIQNRIAVIFIVNQVIINIENQALALHRVIALAKL